MKKRVLSAVIAGILLVATVMPVKEVSATPQNAKEAQDEYTKLTNKINELNEKVQALDAEISPLVEKMKKNEAEISSINTEIDNTNKEIEQTKEEISKQEEVLGERLREVYKSGGELSYLSVIFSANSLSDLISKVSSAKRVIELDNEMIEEINQKKDKLDEKVDSLEKKSEEIKELNKEISKSKSDLEEKKSEQQVLVEQAEQEQSEFDAKYLATFEREIVAGLSATATNANASKEELNNAITQLRAIRDGQLKSPTVIEEVNAAIETAKAKVKQLEEAEAAARAQAQAQAQAQANSSSNNSRGEGVTASGSASAVLNEAYKHIGKWYTYGASGPDTFDCSGFTSYVYRHAVGIEIGRTTYSQINAGREVSYSELQPGDLVFPHAGHVGIYVGNGQMIHAPQTGKQIQVAPVYKFWRARRILN